MNSEEGIREYAIAKILLANAITRSFAIPNLKGSAESV
jgi:hypothetical protein